MKQVFLSDSGFFCENCGYVMLSAVVPKFRIVVDVMGGSKPWSLKLFDQEVSKLIGCPASDFLSGKDPVCLSLFFIDIFLKELI